MGYRGKGKEEEEKERRGELTRSCSSVMSGCVTLTRPALSQESLGVVHGPVGIEGKRGAMPCGVCRLQGF